MRNEIELGRAIREMRKQRGLTQAELAKQAQVSRAYVIMLEQGTGTRAELGRAIRVVRALGQQLALVPDTTLPYEEALQQLLDRG
ncbi:MAG: helix-turn-helix domain-containing protein [Eggerthellaceae bacterium]|nr:helix-turn-helix domain-containing protein [Eggerthellaceae bacterium]